MKKLWMLLFVWPPLSSFFIRGNKILGLQTAMDDSNRRWPWFYCKIYWDNDNTTDNGVENQVLSKKEIQYLLSLSLSFSLWWISGGQKDFSLRPNLCYNEQRSVKIWRHADPTISSLQRDFCHSEREYCDKYLFLVVLKLTRKTVPRFVIQSKLISSL